MFVNDYENENKKIIMFNRWIISIYDVKYFTVFPAVDVDVIGVVVRIMEVLTIQKNETKQKT